MSTQPPAEKPAVDSFAADMARSIGKVITPEGVTNAELEAPEAPKLPDRLPVTMGERVVELQDQRKVEEEAAKLNPPADPPAKEPDPAAPVPAAPVKLVKKTPVVAAPVAAPAPAPAPAPVAAPVTAPAPAKDPDADYIAGLTQDQREELERAAFAEDKFPELKGKRDETLRFFKAVDGFAKDKPDATPEELDQFIGEKKPKWSTSQKRKVDIAFITEQTTATVRKQVMDELQPKIAATERKAKNMEVAPIVDKAVTEFEARIVDKAAVPEKMEGLPEEVLKAIREQGYEKAVELFPIEAPIIASATSASREWLQLSNGVADFNPKNNMHTWLYGFIEQQGKIFQSSNQPLRGLPFKPLLEYLELASTNPKEAAKFSTFNDSDILEMIAMNGTLAYNSELNKLERAGFKREKKNPSPQAPNPAAPAPTAPAPAAPVTTGSPRSKGTSMPGAALPVKKSTEATNFLDKIVPGSSQRLGLT